MISKVNRLKIFAIVSAIIPVMACSLFSGSGNNSNNPASVTPTPTKVIADNEADVESPGPCEGVSGVFEMLILVGPTEGTGLEPIAVGELPFSVIQEEDSFIVKGSGRITYEEVLTEEWGTYTVSLDMNAEIGGACLEENDQGSLDVVVDATGEQMVEVRAEGFSGDYPWSGSHQLDLFFPLAEGAQAEGEGWAFILHLEK